MKTPKVHFVTHNEFDTVSLTTMGVSAKITKAPIGEFGTGMKYAISVLARLNQMTTLTFHGKKWVVCKRSIDFRGKTFDKLFLRAGPDEIIELPFTTELGRKWELWMAFRELESNTRDEGGETIADVEDPEGTLVVTVSGADFRKVYEDRDKYFLNTDRIMAWSYGDVQAYYGTSSKIFYKGIAVHDLEHPSEFTYNLLNANLTEDRTLRNAGFVMSCYIAPAIMEQDPSDVFRLVTKKGCTEFSLDYDYSSPSKESVSKLRDKLKRHNGPVAPMLHLLFSREKYRTINDDQVYEPNSIEARKMGIARNFLDKSGFTLPEGYKEVVADLPELGLCDFTNRTIYISKRVFDLGIREVVKTLLEERVHAQYSVTDLSQGMQDVLFEIIVKMAEKSNNANGVVL